METITAKNKIAAFVDLYDLHTGFFNNVIVGISDEDAHKRLETKANHVAWLTGSLVHQRYEIAKMLGSDIESPFLELFDHNKGIQDGLKYPSLDEYRRAWENISPVLKELMLNVSNEKLDETFEMMPDMKFSNYEMMSFFIYREANCIGQIALWRRLLGYEAMKYM
ncbi:MAG: DinB family protein [Daejeonella sp.]